jgi:hypothetical protein
VELQREAVELASKQVSDASRKGKEAAEAWNKSTAQGHRHDPEGERKWKEAFNETVEAMKRHSAEMDRLFRLQNEEPGRYGRP